MGRARRIFWLGLKEILSLRRDIAMSLLLVWAFSAAVYMDATGKTGSVNNVSVAVVDEDRSALSRALVAGLRPPEFQPPVEIAARFRAFADKVGARFWSGPQDGQNPYLAWLLYSDAAIVTEDSANMLSDAAWHALPIHIARLEGSSPKFDRLHESLISRGCARWFDGTLAHWQYSPLREADRVADAIIEKLIARHPQPALKDVKDQSVVVPDWLE